jgi:predicted TPR repeat methyltransferase
MTKTEVQYGDGHASAEEQSHLKAVTESRKVLYNPNRSAGDYVKTYQDYWARTYTEDGAKLGFKSWQYAVMMIEKYMPKKDALILDYCGGTGQVGQMLSEKGYKHLHISDGSTGMLKQAIEREVYERAFVEVVERGQDVRFLQDAHNKYDVVLSSMSLSEFKSTVEQFAHKALKKGGIFVSIESVPHLTKANLDGIFWVLDECAKPNGEFELLENRDDLPHDDFTVDDCKVLVVRKK